MFLWHHVGKLWINILLLIPLSLPRVATPIQTFELEHLQAVAVAHVENWTLRIELHTSKPSWLHRKFLHHKWLLKPPRWHSDTAVLSKAACWHMQSRLYRARQIWGRCICKGSPVHGKAPKVPFQLRTECPFPALYEFMKEKQMIGESLDWASDSGWSCGGFGKSQYRK